MPQHRFGGQIEAESGLSVSPGVTAPVTDLLTSVGAPHTMSVDDSGKTFLLDSNAGVGFGIVLPTPVGNSGLTYRFVMQTPGGVSPNDDVLITTLGGSFIGTVIEDTPDVNLFTGATITIEGDLSLAGDMIEFHSVGGLWQVRAVTQGALGIVIA